MLPYMEKGLCGAFVDGETLLDHLDEPHVIQRGPYKREARGSECEKKIRQQRWTEEAISQGVYTAMKHQRGKKWIFPRDYNC